MYGETERDNRVKKSICARALLMTVIMRDEED